VVQLYVRQHDAFVSRPVKKLMGFIRLHLEPGERKTVTFKLHSSQFGSHEDGASYVVRPGTVEVLVGNSSERLPLHGTIEVVGQPADMSANRVFFSKARQVI
jgi:beta-glucosidase